MSLAIWLTGISGSGKTTIAEALSKSFNAQDIKHEILDGDVFRSILSPDDGYSEQERDQFRRKVIFIAEILLRNQVICIIPLLSSTDQVRQEARSRLDNFIEVYIKCPLEICEKRDPKGHYKKVREGKITNFVGIHIPYEEPTNPDLTVETEKLSIKDSIELIQKLLKIRFPEDFK